MSLLCHRIASIGSEKCCPKCETQIEVPIPTKELLLSAMPNVPASLPFHSLVDHSRTLGSIVDRVDLVRSLAKKCSCPELSDAFVDNAIRALRTLRAFAIQRTESNCEVRQGSIPNLLSNAAGGNFAGVGGRKRRAARYRKWSEKIRHEKIILPKTELICAIDLAISNYTQR